MSDVTKATAVSPNEVPSAIAERNPIAHPGITSMQCFDYTHAPGDHLKDVYNSAWKAVDDDYQYAPKKLAYLLPRGHGKTEASAVVIPTWVVLRYPNARVAVISKTKRLAEERTSKAVEYIENWASSFGVELESTASTQLTTAANDHKEPTISPYGIESQVTGKHFDVIIWDDIADWENQRTEAQRKNVRNYFRDFTSNLGDPDSVFDGGAVQLMIGTRKHPRDIYATDILDSVTWDTTVRTAIAEKDWPKVERQEWEVVGTDGKVYDSLGDLPEDVNLGNNGVIPDGNISVLWPEHKSPSALLYDIVDSDDSLAIWRRENQQDPQALAGEVFKAEWLDYVDTLPKDPTAYRWLVGMDIGLVEDIQQAAEDDTDYSAIAVVAWNDEAESGYLTDLVRQRGLSVKATAEWAVRTLSSTHVDAMLIEQNANRGVAQRLRDNSPIPARGTTSSGSKEERIHNMAANFESSELRIVGDTSADKWESFETDEWLQFPNSAHDDRLDAIEIALRARSSGVDHSTRSASTSSTNRQSRKRSSSVTTTTRRSI